MPDSEMSFENAMARLEEIVKLLETGKPDLEQSLRLFQEGAGLAAYCHTVLEKARLQIEELSEQKEGESVGI